jgi:hypothetical protein
MSNLGKLPKKDKFKKCKGGVIPGIVKCEEEEHINGMCKFHYEEYKQYLEKEEEKKRAEEEQKKAEEEQKKKGQEKYNENGAFFRVKDCEGNVIAYETKTEVNEYIALKIFILLNTKVINGKEICLIKRDNDTICIFDETKGIWITRENAIKSKIMASNIRIYHISFDEKSQEWVRAKKAKDYSGTLANVKTLYEFMKTNLNEIPEENFIEKNIESNIGKILFQDGIYNFNTNEFTKGFDPNIVFFHRMERNFPARNEEKIEWVKKALFDNLFSNTEEADYDRAVTAKAIYGDYSYRKAYLARGETASGKGTQTKALTLTFPGLVDEFDADELVWQKSTKDKAQMYMWLKDYKTTRLLMSNEVSIEVSEIGKIKTKFDSVKIKKIVSGGDTLKIRGLNEEPYKFTNRATLMLMANDFPEFMPKDEAIADRIQDIYFPYSYKQNPDKDKPHEKLRDESIKKNFDKPEYQDATFWVIADAYKDLVKEKELVAPKIEMYQEKEDYTKDTFESVFYDNFELGGTDEAVQVNDFNRVFETTLGITSKQIGIELKKLSKKLELLNKGKYDFDSKTKKIDKKDIRCRFQVIKKSSI